MKNKERIDFTTKAGKRTLSSIVREIFFFYLNIIVTLPLGKNKLLKREEKLTKIQAIFPSSKSIIY